MAAIAYLRRLDIQELVEVLRLVVSGERLLMDYCIFTDASGEAVRYDIYLTSDGRYEVDADWGDGPVYESSELPGTAVIREIHEAWLAAIKEEEELQALEEYE